MEKDAGNFVNELSNERHKSVAIRQEFRIRYDETSAAVHCFFEGQDDKQFFLGFVRARFGSVGVFPYVCDGKKGVVEVRDRVTREFGSPNVYFFVDKDIDEFFSEQVTVDKNTFMTNHYSFENYIVSEDVLAAIIDDFTHLPKGGNRQVEIFQNFRQLHRRFCRRMLAIMSVVAACRESHLRPSLGNVKLGKMFQMPNDQEIKVLVGSREHLHRGLQLDVSSVAVSSVLIWSKKFREQEEKEWLRGKWELWFFAEFLKRVFEKLERETKGHRRRIRVPASVRDGAVLEIAASRCPEPPELTEFLTRK